MNLPIIQPATNRFFDALADYREALLSGTNVALATIRVNLAKRRVPTRYRHLVAAVESRIRGGQTA